MSEHSPHPPSPTGAALSRARSAHTGHGHIGVLTIGALGVVYGDIGTSPLYAVDQIFIGPASVAPTPDNVLGAISLAIWTITLLSLIHI